MATSCNNNNKFKKKFLVANTQDVKELNCYLKKLLEQGSYTDEQAQDAIGGILDPTEFTYNDNTPSIVINQIDWNKIINVPAIALAANQGLSVATGNVQLGQAIGAIGNPAQITADREIPIGDKGLIFISATGTATTPSSLKIAANVNGAAGGIPNITFRTSFYSSTDHIMEVVATTTARNFGNTNWYGTTLTPGDTFLGCSGFHYQDFGGGSGMHYFIYDFSSTSAGTVSYVALEGPGSFYGNSHCNWVRDGSTQFGLAGNQKTIFGKAIGASSILGFVHIRNNTSTTPSLEIEPSTVRPASINLFTGNIWVDNTVGAVNHLYVKLDGTIYQLDQQVGTFSGSLATDQIAFGSAINTITGSNNLTYTAATGAILQTNNIVTSGAAHTISSNSIDSGNLLRLVSSSTTANGASLSYITSTGVNATIGAEITGQTISIANSGTVPQNTGLNISVSSTSGVNTGMKISATGAGSVNYAAMFNRGIVSLGEVGTESGRLQFNGSVGGTLTLQPNSNFSSFTMTWPTSNSTGTQALFNNGSGTLSWASVSAGTVTTITNTPNQGASITITNPTTTPDLTIALGILTGITSIASGPVVSTGVVASGTQLRAGQGTSTAMVYRTTNGGSDISPRFALGSGSNTAGVQALFGNVTGGHDLVFAAANGTRPIARAAISIVNLVNTAGAESADLSFLTQNAGAAVLEVVRITSVGTVVFTTPVTTGSTTTSGFSIVAGSLTTGTAAYIASSTLTSGNLLQLVCTSTALAANNEGFDISISGANGTVAITVTGIRATVTNTNATSGTNIAAQFNASGATTANWAIYTGSATGADGRINVNNATDVANQIIVVKSLTNTGSDGIYVTSNNASQFVKYAPLGVYTTNASGLIIESTAGMGFNGAASARVMTLLSNGLLFVGGTTTPTARVHVAAGTTTIPPILLISGTNTTTAVAGAFEYNGADLFFTKTGTTRGNILVATVVTTEVVVSDTTLTITYNGTTYKLLARA